MNQSMDRNGIGRKIILSKQLGAKMISVETTYKKAVFMIKFKKHDRKALKLAIDTLENLIPIIMSDLESYKELFYHLANAYYQLKDYKTSLKFANEMLNNIEPKHERTIELKQKLLDVESEKVGVKLGGSDTKKKIGQKKYSTISILKGSGVESVRENHEKKKNKNRPPISSNTKKHGKVSSPRNNHHKRNPSKPLPNSSISKQKGNKEEVIITKKKHVETKQGDTPLIKAENIITQLSKGEYDILSSTFHALSQKKKYFTLSDLSNSMVKFKGIKSSEFFIEHVLFTSFMIISKITDLRESIDVKRVSFDKFLTAMGIYLKGDLFQQFNLSFEIFAFYRKENFVDFETFQKFINCLYEILDDFGLLYSDDYNASSGKEKINGKIYKLFQTLDIRKKKKVEKIDFITGLVNNIDLLTSLGVVYDNKLEKRMEVTSFKKFGSNLVFGKKEFNYGFNVLLGMNKCYNVFKYTKKFNLKNEDFYNEYKICLPKCDKGKHHSFTVHNYFVFKKLREIFGVDEEEFQQSFSVTKLLGNLLFGNLQNLYFQSTMGRSHGTFFYYSHNGKYLIKKISKEEFKIFQNTLPQYFDHMKFIKKINKVSLLTKCIYGFVLDNDCFIVMLNIFSTGNEINEIYDLKGSRIARSNPKGPIFKDNDLKQKLIIGKKKKQLLFKVITQDVNILNFLKLTDYSLLLGINYVSGKRSTINPDTYFPKGINEELFLKKMNEGKKRGKKKKKLFFSGSASNKQDQTQAIKDMSDIIVKEQSSANKGGNNQTTSNVGHARNISVVHETFKEDTPVKMEKACENFSELFLEDGGIVSKDGKEIYYLGIIDLLTTFTLYKQAERELKTLQNLGHRKEISSQPHKFYSERLLTYLENVFE